MPKITFDVYSPEEILVQVRDMVRVEVERQMAAWSANTMLGIVYQQPGNSAVTPHTRIVDMAIPSLLRTWFCSISGFGEATVGEVCSHTEHDFSRYRLFGHKKLLMLLRVLWMHGLSLNKDPEVKRIELGSTYEAAKKAGKA